MSNPKKAFKVHQLKQTINNIIHLTDAQIKNRQNINDPNKKGIKKWIPSFEKEIIKEDQKLIKLAKELNLLKDS
jgi:ferritin-like metal-binding protein YciE